MLRDCICQAQCSLAAVVLVSSFVGLVSAGHNQNVSWMRLEDLWRAEYKVIEDIKAIMRPVAELSDVLQRYVSSWEAVVGVSDNPDWNIGDPASGFSLLRHITEGWTLVDDAFKNIGYVKHIVENLTSRLDRESLPTTDDLVTASEAIIRLAHVYQLNTTAIADGGHLVQLDVLADYHHTLSASELASIALVAVKKGFLNVGVEFLLAAKGKASVSQQARLDSLLASTVKLHDHVLKVRGPRSLTHVAATLPYDHPERSTAVTMETTVVLGVDFLRKHADATWMLERRPLVEQMQVERLCRGEDLRVTSRLDCRYVTAGSPWLTLAPFKVEQLSRDPYIIVIYELMSRHEQDQLKERMKNVLQASYTPCSDVQILEGNCARLPESEETVLKAVERRLSKVLGVTLADSEPCMVADYGLGSEYNAHRDTHGPSRATLQPDIGERMATILLHLQTPTQGGRTVFPWVGAGVDGAAGAAVVWWNLLSSHEHDFLTRHAACPVLHGHKTVLTKWVGYVPQWGTIPCSVDSSRKIMQP